MPIEETNLAAEQAIIDLVHRTVEAHGATADELIPILFDLNKALGYIPVLVMTQVAKAMRLPLSRINSVASFYSMLATEPRGRHVIQFCESAPCHVMGGRAIWSYLTEELGLTPGKISPDGRWSFVSTSCLGVCGVGPVIIIDDDLYGNFAPAELPDILAKYE
jgi:NADH:ubiquinone oxidoreductase subunit E